MVSKVLVIVNKPLKMAGILEKSARDLIDDPNNEQLFEEWSLEGTFFFEESNQWVISEKYQYYNSY